MVAAVPVPAAVRTTLAGIVAEVLDSGRGAAATCTAGRGSPHQPPGGGFLNGGG